MRLSLKARRLGDIATQPVNGHGRQSTVTGARAHVGASYNR